MKWILFLFIAKGAPQATAEQYMALMQEFDDKPACEAALVKLRTVSREAKIGGMCLAKGTEPAGTAK